MKRIFVFTLSTALFTAGSLVGTASSASAEEAPANVCVHKVTGAIRNSAEPNCLATELAIGATAIAPGATRPKKFDPTFANRIKVAQLLGKKKGHTLRITSGWRSVAYQQMLFKRAIKKNGSVAAASKWVLPPEYSMHPWGLAVDINYGAGKKSGAAWLEANGYLFGLCRRYQNEWWHFEPLVAPGQPCPALEPYPVVQ